MSKEAARFFYIGMVGDNGRFQFSSTTQHTFQIASELLKTGISIGDIYNEMYLKQIDDLYVTAYVLNHFEISKDGIAYYVLSDETQKELGISREQGKENVNLFSNIAGLNAWCSVTEDPQPKDYCWRVSIRSKKLDISGIASKWEGGGHPQASGAKVRSLDKLPELIKDLDELFI